jgi:hypothetical protein
MQVRSLQEMGMKTSKDMVTDVNYTKGCPLQGAHGSTPD